MWVSKFTVTLATETLTFGTAMLSEPVMFPLAPPASSVTLPPTPVTDTAPPASTSEAFETTSVVVPDAELSVKLPDSVCPSTEICTPVPDTWMNCPTGRLTTTLCPPTVNCVEGTARVLVLTCTESVPLTETPGTFRAIVPVNVPATPPLETSSAPLPPESVASPPPNDADALVTAIATSEPPPDPVVTWMARLALTDCPEIDTEAPSASTPKNGPAGMPWAAVEVVLRAIATLESVTPGIAIVLTVALSEPTMPAGLIVSVPWPPVRLR